MKSVQFVVGFLVVALLGMSLMAFGPRHRPKHRKVSTKAVRELKGKLSAMKSKRDTVKTELRQTVKQANGVSMDLTEIDAELYNAQNALSETEQKLTDQRKEQKAIAKSLVQSQFELAGQAADMRKRLRAMYEEGDTPLVSVILGSASSGNIADRAYLIKRVATADSDKLRAYRTQFDRYQADKAKKDALVSSILVEEQNEVAQKQTLASAQTQKQDTLDSLQAKKESLQQILDQMDQDQATIEREIIQSESVPSKGEPVKFNGRFIWPCRGPITSPFGMRYHPIFHVYRMHTGIDIGVPMGTPIHAAATGTVITAQYLKGYGNTVIIDHGGGVSTVYGHASKLLVSAGEHVNQGQTIALAGMTGYATGPHCHFEVRLRGKVQNPIGFLKG